MTRYITVPLDYSVWGRRYTTVPLGYSVTEEGMTLSAIYHYVGLGVSFGGRPYLTSSLMYYAGLKISVATFLFTALIYVGETH